VVGRRGSRTRVWFCVLLAIALGGKWRPSVGKVGEWFVKSRHLQGYSLRLYRLRTDGLAPASKYRTYRAHVGVYGPSKPSSLSWIEAWLKTTILLVGLGEKLSMDPRISQPACCTLCRQPFFLGSPFSRGQWDPSKSVDDS
jgi:hypothetical protein